MIMRYLQVGGLAAGLAGGSPGGLGNIADFVRGAPSQAAGMMENNPAIGPSLAQNFDPGQLKDVFGPIGVNRNEQNPMMSDDKSPLPVTPVKGGGGGDWAGGGYAQGGYITEPGYYQRGGRSRRNPALDELDEYYRRLRQRGPYYSPNIEDRRPPPDPFEKIPSTTYPPRPGSGPGSGSGVITDRPFVPIPPTDPRKISTGDLMFLHNLGSSAD